VARSKDVKLPKRQSQVLEWLEEAGAPVYRREICVAENAVAALAYCESYQSTVRGGPSIRQALGCGSPDIVILCGDLRGGSL
jgi:hypothetical protein